LIVDPEGSTILFPRPDIIYQQLNQSPPNLTVESQEKYGVDKMDD